MRTHSKPQLWDVNFDGKMQGGTVVGNYNCSHSTARRLYDVTVILYTFASDSSEKS